ncbi:MAG: cold shock domain-containing protein [Mycobacteriaceae bacterium]|nr:cold shock domain-containing protein [Mycobacteriaceae bacterium]
MTLTGRVLKFDEVRGYGFVSPDSGGEDVFLHVNDIEFDKQLLAPGVVVEFEAEKSERGFKASHVRIPGRGELRAEEPRPLPVHLEVAPAAEPVDDLMSDVLTANDFRREVTEAILASAPSVTGAEIRAIRDTLERLAATHGWIG